MTTLARVLKSRRIKRNLTQADVASALGYGTPQFVSNLERGVALPPIKALPILASQLKMPLQTLVDLRFGVLEAELKREKAMVKRELRA